MRTETAAILIIGVATLLAGCGRDASQGNATATGQAASQEAASTLAPAPVSAGLACNIDQQFFGGKVMPMTQQVSLAADQYLAGAGWVLDPGTGMPPAKVTIALTSLDDAAAQPVTGVEVDTGIPRPGVLETVKGAAADAKPGFMFHIAKEKLPKGSYSLRITDSSGKPLCDRSWAINSL